LNIRRRKGKFIHEVVGHPDWGIPFGQDRLVLLYMATLAVRYQSPSIYFRHCESNTVPATAGLAAVSPAAPTGAPVARTIWRTSRSGSARPPHTLAGSPARGGRQESAPREKHS
jgi:hypothetical protein